MLRLSSIIFVTIIFIGCGEGNKKGTPSQKYSTTIDESKKVGAFEFEVVPYRTSLTLSKELKLEVMEAWVEHVWTSQNQIIGRDPIDVFSEHQIVVRTNIINTTETKKKKFFYFIGNDLLDTLTHYRLGTFGRISVPIYREKVSELPETTKAFDSLIFVRVNNR